VLDAAREDLADELRRLTDGAGVDVVIDNLALAELFGRYMPALATTGRVVVSGAIAFDPLPLDARSLYVNSQSIVGVRTGNLKRIAAFWETVRDGYRLREDVIERFPLERAADAHVALTERGLSGHVVLTVMPEEAVGGG
jgi:NADPH2:quinone reductase